MQKKVAGTRNALFAKSIENSHARWLISMNPCDSLPDSIKIVDLELQSIATQLARLNEIIFQEIAVYTSLKLKVGTIDVRSYEEQPMESTNRINGTNGRKLTNSRKIKKL